MNIMVTTDGFDILVLTDNNKNKPAGKYIEN